MSQWMLIAIAVFLTFTFFVFAWLVIAESSGRRTGSKLQDLKDIWPARLGMLFLALIVGILALGFWFHVAAVSPPPWLEFLLNVMRGIAPPLAT